VEHRLFGTAALVAVVSTGSGPFGVGVKESGASGGWCLARCWVLKARAFCLGFSVWALLVPVPAVTWLFGLWFGGGVCGVPPVF